MSVITVKDPDTGEKIEFVDKKKAYRYLNRKIRELKREGRDL